MSDGEGKVPPKAATRYFREHGLRALQDRSGFDSDEISLFRWYVQENENVIVEMSESVSRSLQEQEDANVEEIDDSSVIPLEYFIRRARYSHVVYLASLLEKLLNTACQKLKRTLNPGQIPVPLKEIRGDQWDSRKKFLEGYGHFELPADLWGHLRKLIVLRNSIIHDNGETSSITEPRKNELRKLDGVVVDDWMIIVEATYIDKAAGWLQEFDRHLNELINAVIDRAIRPNPVA